MTAEVDRADGLGARRVLHHRLGRRDRAVLRGPGARGRAGRHGAAALRPPRLAGHPGLQGVRGTAGRRPASSGTRCCRSSRSRAQFRRPDLRNHRKILVVDGAVAFTGSQNLIEPGYNKPKNHEAGREWVELMARVEGPIVTALNLALRHRLVQRDRRELDRRDRHRHRRPSAEIVAGQVIPSGPGFATENNLRAVHHPDLLGAAPDLDHQPLLRARRVAAVRRHHRRPARRRRRALRQRGGRPVHGLPRPVLLLRGPARAGRADLPLPRAVRSCTPSTSPSTTTSR